MTLPRVSSGWKLISFEVWLVKSPSALPDLFLVL